MLTNKLNTHNMDNIKSRNRKSGNLGDLVCAYYK